MEKYRLTIVIIVLFADVYENTALRGSSPQAIRDAHARFNIYMNQIRQATPEGGSYLNEGDVEEPDWQRAFLGTNYGRLREAKATWDPWGVFHAPVTVGSEDWEVRGVDHGLPTQDGPLCRVAS